MRVDIALGNKIAVELKHDLNTPPKLQRLKGQLDDHGAAFGSTIVVLTGDPQRDLVKRSKQAASKYGIDVIEK